MTLATWHLKRSLSPFSFRQWYAVCIASNGRSLSRTTEFYKNRQDCIDAVLLTRAASFDSMQQPEEK